MAAPPSSSLPRRTLTRSGPTVSWSWARGNLAPGGAGRTGSPVTTVPVSPAAGKNPRSARSLGRRTRAATRAAIFGASRPRERTGPLESGDTSAHGIEGQARHLSARLVEQQQVGVAGTVARLRGAAMVATSRCRVDTASAIWVFPLPVIVTSPLPTASLTVPAGVTRSLASSGLRVRGASAGSVATRA